MSSGRLPHVTAVRGESGSSDTQVSPVAREEWNVIVVLAIRALVDSISSGSRRVEVL
jgi:hypothetical protein